MNAFTVLCRDLNDVPASTTWVGHASASDPLDAARIGRRECAADWGYEEQDVSVIAVLEGHISVALWEDAGLELDLNPKGGENPNTCTDIQVFAHGASDSRPHGSAGVNPHFA